MGIIHAGDSDIGRKRKTNQDSICMDPEHLFFAVADGMGGHNGGDIASQMTVALMPPFIKKNKDQIEPKDLVAKCIQFVNNEIHAKSDMQPELKGMGTTVSAVMFRGNKLLIGNVGDSRVYMIHDGQVFQMTRDHSFVQEKLNMGLYGRAEAAMDKQKNVLVRSVGFEPDVQVDVFTYQICKNDLFLICSDGLHGKVSDRDILYIVQKNVPQPNKATVQDLQRAVKELIAQANANGGQDNISVILSVAQE
jgi:serine/threonine protein phosphatase PrpC